MEKNKRLKPRNILEKPIYNSILKTLNIFEDKKVKFCHLKYALVNKKYNQLKEKMEDFFIDSKAVEFINSLKKEYEKGTINNKTYTALMGVLKQNYLQDIKHKLGSESSLRDKLYELIKLGVIEKKSDKKGYPYYVLTDIGKKFILRYNVHYLIDLSIKDEELKQFYNRLVEYIFKKEKVLIS